eukprot:6794890-Karenia_brevis.AAC.1
MTSQPDSHPKSLIPAPGHDTGGNQNACSVGLKQPCWCPRAEKRQEWVQIHMHFQNHVSLSPSFDMNPGYGAKDQEEATQAW